MQRPEMDIQLHKLKHQGYLQEAKQARLVAQYLHQTKAQRTWRFRLADILLRLATRLSPHHRAILQSARQTSGTMG